MKREKIKTGIFFGAILVAIMISGCIGGEDGGEEKPSGEQPSAGEKTPAEQPPEEEKKGMSLADIFNLGKPGGYTASYDITGKGMGGVSKMTLYFAGEKKMRSDTIMNDAEGTSEMSIFMIADKVHMCTRTDGEWMCLTTDATTEDWKDIAQEFENDMEKPVHDGTQNIAGITGECYKLESTGTEYRYCP